MGSVEEKEVLLIDPGGCFEEVTGFLDEKGLIPKLIIATHGHLDHISAIPGLRKKWNVKVACHTEDIQYFMNPDPVMEEFLGRGYEPFKPEQGLEDGEQIHIGPYTMEVIHTPGHTPGSICLLSSPFIFTGDTLFKAGFGRTDFPGGDYNALANSVRSRLWSLAEDLILLPGHGDFSSLGVEKERGFF